MDHGGYDPCQDGGYGGGYAPEKWRPAVRAASLLAALIATRDMAHLRVLPHLARRPRPGRHNMDYTPTRWP